MYGHLAPPQAHSTSEPQILVFLQHTNQYQYEDDDHDDYRNQQAEVDCGNFITFTGIIVVLWVGFVLWRALDDCRAVFATLLCGISTTFIDLIVVTIVVLVRRLGAL